MTLSARSVTSPHGAPMVRLESSDGVPAGNVKTLTSVKSAIEKAGIEFIGSPEEGAGVRWKAKK